MSAYWLFLSNSTFEQSPFSSVCRYQSSSFVYIVRPPHQCKWVCPNGSDNIATLPAVAAAASSSPSVRHCQGRLTGLTVAGRWHVFRGSGNAPRSLIWHLLIAGGVVQAWVVGWYLRCTASAHFPMFQDNRWRWSFLSSRWISSNCVD